MIKFLSNELPKSEIDKILSEYKSSYEGKANKALDIIKIYLERNTDIINPSIDFNWDVISEFEGGDDDFLPCGFFTEDEIIIIAHWFPNSNKILYNEHEINRAIDSYDNGDMM